MRSKPVGSIVGAVFGLIFVLTSAGSIPAPLVWRLAAAVAFGAIIWFVVLRGPEAEFSPPTRSAIRTYGFSVTAMALSIPVGGAVLRNVFVRPDVVLVWVVFVVGVHFLPFSKAFGIPIFTWLAAALMLVAVVGGIAALPTNDATSTAATGVAAGFVLLLFAAIGPRLMRHTTVQAD